MQRIVSALVLMLAVAHVDARAQRQRPTTGPSAASLATPYSGPLKFNPRVLSAERAAAYDANPVTRGATWRYRYASPFSCYWNCWGSRGYCGAYRGFYPFSGGATSLGWWGPY